MLGGTCWHGLFVASVPEKTKPQVYTTPGAQKDWDYSSYFPEEPDSAPSNAAGNGGAFLVGRADQPDAPDLPEDMIAQGASLTNYELLSDKDRTIAQWPTIDGGWIYLAPDGHSYQITPKFYRVTVAGDEKTTYGSSSWPYQEGAWWTSYDPDTRTVALDVDFTIRRYGVIDMEDMDTPVLQTISRPSGADVSLSSADILGAWAEEEDIEEKLGLPGLHIYLDALRPDGQTAVFAAAAHLGPSQSPIQRDILMYRFVRYFFSVELTGSPPDVTASITVYHDMPATAGDFTSIPATVQDIIVGVVGDWDAEDGEWVGGFHDVTLSIGRLPARHGLPARDSFRMSLRDASIDPDIPMSTAGFRGAGMDSDWPGDSEYFTRDGSVTAVGPGYGSTAAIGVQFFNYCYSWSTHGLMCPVGDLEDPDGYQGWTFQAARYNPHCYGISYQRLNGETEIATDLTPSYPGLLTPSGYSDATLTGRTIMYEPYAAHDSHYATWHPVTRQSSRRCLDYVTPADEECPDPGPIGWV